MADINSICVYCGSSSNTRASHRQAAIEFGSLLAAEGNHTSKNVIPTTDGSQTIEVHTPSNHPFEPQYGIVSPN